MAGSKATTKAHCNVCGGEKTHRVLHVEKTRWEADETPEIYGEDTFTMLMCGGCEGVKLQHSKWCTEDDPYDSREPTYYPPAIFRPSPRWFTELRRVLSKEDRVVHALLGEIYVALQNDLPRLATMGVRALLEHIMVSKAGDRGTFAKNMDEFEKLGFVSKQQRKRLDAILEAGHATMHRAYEPETEDVVTLLNVTEHIVETVFLHEKAVERLKGKIPPRKRS